MPQIYHLEITSPEPENSVQFYEDVFDWRSMKKAAKNEEYWILHTGSGSDVHCGVKRRTRPADRLVPHIEVSSMDEYEKKIVQHGGKSLAPRQKIPGTGVIQYFEDPAGNTLCLVEKG